MTHLSEGPAYLAVVTALRERISSGKYAVGSQLPSQAKIMAEFDTTESITRRALSALREEGLISSHQGVGHFVRAQPVPSADITVAMRAIDEVRVELHKLGRQVEHLEDQLQRMQDDRRGRPAASSPRPPRRSTP
jgi:DNA-binding GntR family transcriptional regulator